MTDQPTPPRPASRLVCPECGIVDMPAQRITVTQHRRKGETFDECTCPGCGTKWTRDRAGVIDDIQRPLFFVPRRNLTAFE